MAPLSDENHPPAGARQAAEGGLGVGDATDSASEACTRQDVRRSIPAISQGLDFLKRRFARSIELGDDKHAEVIRQLLDRLMNGSAR